MLRRSPHQARMRLPSALSSVLFESVPRIFPQATSRFRIPLPTFAYNLFDVFEYKREYRRKASSLPPFTLTGIIDRREDKKLIQRLRTNADRREINLATTAQGNKIVETHIRENELFAEKVLTP